jgi:TPP-dependent pyruvate/acetoin dehydrogenase alpha subunit
MTDLAPQDLRDFEEQIAELYRAGKIRAPIHLRAGYEDRLIEIFRNVRRDDFVFGYWGSHLHCLLKGVPPGELRQSILEGNSIALSFPDHRILCSGIVGSLAGVAVGTAWGVKHRGGQERVWLFTGDMGAECGIFHEALKFATGHDLPLSFVVEDNGVSVLTDTRATWGSKEPWFLESRFRDKVIYFRYENKWPHSGIGQRIAF